jgi:hypothetical protein
VVWVVDTAMTAAEGILDTSTSVVGRGGQGRRVEEPCAASAGAAAAAVAVVAAVNSPQNRVDHDSRNMGVDHDILDSRRCCQTIRIHARPLPVINRDALPIQRCPGNIVVGVVVAAVVVAVDTHPGHTAEEAPSIDPVEVVRDDSLVDVAARSKVGSIRS